MILYNEKTDPEEIIDRLEELLRYLEKRKVKVQNYDEEKLSNSPMDRN